MNKIILPTLMVMISVAFIAAAAASQAPISDPTNSSNISDVIKNSLNSQSKCQNFVRYDSQNIYLGFGTKGLKNQNSGSVTVTSLSNSQDSFDLITSDGAIDSVAQGSDFFILTNSGIEHWDLNLKKRIALISSFNLANFQSRVEQPQSLARYKDKVIIAHGLLGVSFFDLNSKKITNQLPLIQDRLPLRSIATGVTVVGQFAYVIMDTEWPVGMFKKPFRGVVVIDMESEKVISELEGLDPGVDAVSGNENELLVSYGGVIFWKYSIGNLHGKKLPQPEARIWQFPITGHPVGQGVLDGKYYFTCVSNEGGKVIPSALDRTLWGF